MTRDEYDAMSLDEAEVTFHRDPAAREVYVTAQWGAAAGFKFRVAEELLPATMSMRDAEQMSSDLSLVEGYMRGADAEPKVSQAFMRLRDGVLNRTPTGSLAYDVVKSWVRDAVGEMPMAKSEDDVERACDLIGKHVVRGLRAAGVGVA